MKPSLINVKHLHIHLPQFPPIPSAELLANPIPAHLGEAMAEAPIARFELSANGATVIDHRTVLMWTQEESPKRLTFAEAESHCTELRTGGFTDWRLPDLEELESIRDITRHKPCLDTSVFKSNSSWVWSRTPTAWSPDFAWVVGFYDGYVYGSHRDDGAFVRAVRRVSPAGQ